MRRLFIILIGVMTFSSIYSQFSMKLTTLTGKESQKLSELIIQEFPYAKILNCKLRITYVIIIPILLVLGIRRGLIVSEES